MKRDCVCVGMCGAVYRGVCTLYQSALILSCIRENIQLIFLG